MNNFTIYFSKTTFLKKLFDFYLQSSLHVAFAVYCLVQIPAVCNQQPLNYQYSFCVFFGTILGYNFLKYFEIFTRVNFRFNKYYSIITVTFLAGIGFLYLFYFLNGSVQKLILVSGVFVLMYPFLRKIGWLKLFLVSFVVTFITVYIPLKTGKCLPFELYISIIQRFLILISLLIPFEIMDSKTDEQSLNTLPQLFGIVSTKLFGIILIVPFIVLEFLKADFSFVVFPIGLITAALIHFTEVDRNKYYTSFWVESVPVLWLGILLIFGYIF
jgi:hypothetical protein